MLETFYARLCRLAENDGELCLLRAQWDFDLKLYENALNHVGRLYNHFSRHDASHSRKLLVNMGKLLGNELERMDATDIWLMLEAAFLHDLGMLVPYELLKHGLESQEFRRHVEDIAGNPRHELHRYVAALKPDQPETWLEGEHPLDAVNHFHQLVVSWYRGRHGELSGDVALHPESVGIFSPRNALVPDRLFRLLGNVSHTHTTPFACVMDLPEVENGMSNDICHPRFVACLLRLGDLLDLDNGRFCPVMARLYGPAPQSRKAHEDKHASIRHFVCTPDVIEIEAECESDEGYAETARWMNMLRGEIADQNAQWNRIIPAGCAMRLPSVSKIDVRHRDNTLLEGGTLPRITLNEDKALVLLQGAGLYKNKWQAVRELVQNAVDATLIRMWIEHEKDIIEESILPYSREFKALAESYPIHVYLKRLSDNTAERGKKTDTIRYKVTIQDVGCGISEATFKSMIRVASSSDVEKRSIIAAMPEWMKPSGVFGLGLQSAFFLGADRLMFKTRSLLDGTCAEIVLPSPRNMGQKYAKYLTLPFDCRSPVGTTLSFFLEQKGLPQHLSGDFIFISDATSDFDPVCDEELPLIPAYLSQEIKKMEQLSLVPIKFIMDGEEVLFERKNDTEYSKRTMFFSNENIFVCLKFITRTDRVYLKYRGQIIEDAHYYLPFVCGEINILHSRADSMLSINRNKIQDNAINKIYMNIKNVIIQYIKKVLEDDFGNFSEQEKVYASACLEIIGEKEDRGNKLWKKIKIHEEKNIEEILTSKSNIYYMEDKFPANRDNVREDDYQEFRRDDDRSIIINSSEQGQLFLLELVRHGWFLVELTPRGFARRYYCVKQDRFPYSRRVFIDHIKCQCNLYARVGVRCVMPAWGDYTHLIFAGPVWCGKLSTIEGRDSILLPYKFSSTENKVVEDDVDILSDWCYRHQVKPGAVSLEKIRECYEALQKELSAIMSEDDELAAMLVRRPVLAESGGNSPGA